MRPVCRGNGDEHCCYVDGEVCRHLRIDDPRAGDRKYACGLLLDLIEQSPDEEISKLWQEMYELPEYQDIRAHFEKVGVALCGDFVGSREPDGTYEGQCCFAGYRFDSEYNVIEEPNG